MEKVKLTKKQAEAIESLLNSKVWDRDEIVERHAYEEPWMEAKNRCLNTLTLPQLAKSLYIGYEVEPEFKAGDWIYIDECATHTNREHIRRIVSVNPPSITLDDSWCIGLESGHIRHATLSEITEEKERRLFARHGRKPWELKVGDVLVKKMDNFPLVVTEVNAEEITLNLLTCTRSEVKKCCKVLCFADDRLDVSAE